MQRSWSKMIYSNRQTVQCRQIILLESELVAKVVSERLLDIPKRIWANKLKNLSCKQMCQKSKLPLQGNCILPTILVTSLGERISLFRAARNYSSSLTIFLVRVWNSMQAELTTTPSHSICSEAYAADFCKLIELLSLKSFGWTRAQKLKNSENEAPRRMPSLK